MGIRSINLNLKGEAMKKAQEIIRHNILQIAAKEFSEKGYDTANINQIAVLSGIGKGTIYNYFSNKKELYLETIRYTIQLINMISDSIYEETKKGAGEKLKRIIINYFQFNEEHLPFLKLWARHLFQDEPTFSNEVSELFQEMKHPLRDIVIEGAESGEFKTENPLASSYIVLSTLVLLSPALNAKSMPILVPEKQRVDFALNSIGRLLNCSLINK